MPSGKTVLVIDDDHDIREAVVDTLSDEGYAAVAVPDGGAGLTYLSTHAAPALILLDWNMTPMNGLQFMAEFTKSPHWASIPVVLLSADQQVDEKVKLAAFASFLRKPVELSDLFAIVERYCS